jgi:tape measure domain-containing protein
MSDSAADFTLRLKNQVTAPARAMSRSIRGLSDDLRSKQKFFAKGETDFQKKLKESRRLADRTHRQDLRDMKAKRVAAQRLAATASRLQLRNEKRGAQEDSAGRSVAIGAIGAVATAAVVGAAAVGLMAAKFTSATLAAVTFGQRSKTALASILKDAPLAAQQFGGVRREAGMLGIDVFDTVDSFKMLANAGFQVPMARDLVRMSADLQSLTGSSESAHFALRAISQIKMKGRLQAEEITGQLAEHGVSADEVYRVLGKTLGKTREEILKMQKAGDLSADVAIPAILQAVRNQLGVEKSGGFALKMNMSSIGGMWSTLKSQVQNAFVSLGERVEPGVTRAFQSIMTSIQKAVASPQMTAFTNAVVGMFDTLSEFAGRIDFATLLKESATTLGGALTEAGTFAREHGAELRDSFMLFVRAMVSGMRAVGELMAPVVKFMASDFGKFLLTPASESDNSVVRFLGSPLNETLGSEPDAAERRAIAESKARAAASRSGSASVAAQAGAAMASNKNVNVTMSGDFIFQGSAAASPSDHAGQFKDQIRRELTGLLEDL